MRSEGALVNQIRELMEPGNPVPATTYYGEAPYQAEIAALLTELRSAAPEQAEPMPVDPVHDQPARRPGRTSAWRVLAPVLSSVAVLAVVTSLTLAGGGQGRDRSKGGPQTSAAAALPRYYARAKGTVLTIHRTSTGKTVAILPTTADTGPITAVAAGSSGRVFYLVVNLSDGQSRMVFEIQKAQMSADGSWAISDLVGKRFLVGKHLTPFPNAFVDGVAASPDGRKLAIAMELGDKASAHAVMEVIPLDGKSATRVWSAPTVPAAYALDPVWTDNHDLAFLWYDHVNVSATKLSGRTQERVLDTALPGLSLMSSKVLITSKSGFMATAYASPHGGPIFANIVNDAPAGGTSGVFTNRLVWFTPNQDGFTVLATHKVRYHNLAQRADAGYFYQVFGIDRAGKHALVSSPHLGTMTIYKLSPLRGVRGRITSAAW